MSNYQPITSSVSFLKSVCLILALALLNGCVALQPFPMAGQAGDTVTLAVGSADGMNAGNTTVEFFPPGADPDTDPGIPVPIREIVKMYPDKTSHAWLGGEPRKIPRRSSHGGWLSVVVVDLPGTLPTGDGVIRVSTTSAVSYPRFSATPDGLDIPFTVLPGTGSANPFDYSVIDGSTLPGDLMEVAALPHVIVRPEVLPEGQAETERYGAIEFDITVPIINLGGGAVLDEGIAVILDDQPQNINNQTNLIWRRVGDNYRIMLVSPVGMYGYEARVSIVPMFPEYLYQISGAPLLNSIAYYDLNGVIDTSAPTATISLAP